MKHSDRFDELDRLAIWLKQSQMDADAIETVSIYILERVKQLTGNESLLDK